MVFKLPSNETPLDDGPLASQLSTAEGEPANEGSPAETTELPALHPNDIVVAVMGVTGAGKTTFISHFAPEAKVGHGLESCTSTVSIYKTTMCEETVYLIDTPGFDDTHRSDTDILRELANWLNAAYQKQIQLAGIIYLHRIIDNRMSGSATKNLRMFRRLCGDDALSCVVLATTMWSQVSREDGTQREQELTTRPEFWAALVACGSTVLRQDNGAASATAIMQHVLSRRRRRRADLALQTEMAGGRPLDETAAGREVQADMAALRRRYEAELAALRVEMEQARRAHDGRTQREIAAVRAELEEKLRRDRAERDRLCVTVGELQRDHTERAAAHERELQWTKEMLQAEAEIAREKAAGQANEALMGVKLQLAVREAENARLEREAAERERGGCRVM
ncbi:hypothetical protein BT67DRAFT_422637 [Trichocladium antarcticum]|uniref:G domain-containing protein n=1 Tax=Trichocladium antarcticum TaxID=1450529 RepID=A0AAN6UJS8_9PEZI|nr:hypothetical protein BT67DRAFT_422637 [Trichocladium antarcticum]